MVRKRDATLPVCKSCGTENGADSIYCEDCGAQMSPAAETAAATPGPGTGDSVRIDGRTYLLSERLESGTISRYLASSEDQPYLVVVSRDECLLTHQLENAHHLAQLSPNFLAYPTQKSQNGDYWMAATPRPGSTTLLTKVQQQGPLSEDEVDQLARNLLVTVGAAHEGGYVLASLQPSRVWLDGDQALIDSLERAALLEQLETSNSEAPTAVAAGFSPPELYGLGQIGTASDLFSLAAVLHFSLSGQVPNFEARENFFVAAPAAVKERKSLGYVIHRSLQKFTADRFPDATSMLFALDAPVPAEPVAAPSPVPAPVPVPVAAAAAAGGTASGPKKNGGAPPSSYLSPYCSPRCRFSIASRSHVGCVRQINQDACLELNFSFYEKSELRHAQFLAVIDGMGGEAEGDKAASIALRSIGQAVVSACLTLRDSRQTSPLLDSDPLKKYPQILSRALETANRNIYDYSCLNEARRGMGCTISCCLVVERDAYFGHVGDTRGYHFRQSFQPALQQVTTDHSLVGRLVAMGSLTPEEARVSPQRSIIFRAMGTGPDIEVDTYNRCLEVGDRIILCSDGVWEYFEAGEFCRLVESCQSPEEVCHTLVDICLQRGADDNATVAVLQVLE